MKNVKRDWVDPERYRCQNCGTYFALYIHRPGRLRKFCDQNCRREFLKKEKVKRGHPEVS